MKSTLKEKVSILRSICLDEYDIDILDRARHRPIVHMRRVAIKILRDETVMKDTPITGNQYKNSDLTEEYGHRYSYPELARELGLNHCSVLYHYSKWIDDSMTWPDLIPVRRKVFEAYVDALGLAPNDDIQESIKEDINLSASLKNKLSEYQMIINHYKSGLEAANARIDHLERDYEKSVERKVRKTVRKMVGTNTIVKSTRTIDIDDVMNVIRERMRVGTEKDVILHLTRFFNGYPKIE